MPFTPAPDTRPYDAPWPAMTWPPTLGVVLRGQHVELRAAEDHDSEELYAALDDDRCWTHVAGRPPDADGWSTLLHTRRSAGWHPWTVRSRGRVVGTTSYLDVEPEDARLEIGFTVYAAHVWATAVNPATKLLLLTHCFEVLGAGRVQLKTDVRNHRSQRAIARLGAQYEGTLRRYQRRSDGTVRDTAMFSITAEDWPALRSNLSNRLEATKTVAAPRLDAPD